MFTSNWRLPNPNTDTQAHQSQYSLSSHLSPQYWSLAPLLTRKFRSAHVQYLRLMTSRSHWKHSSLDHTRIVRPALSRASLPRQPRSTLSINALRSASTSLLHSCLSPILMDTLSTFPVTITHNHESTKRPWASTPTSTTHFKSSLLRPLLPNFAFRKVTVQVAVWMIQKWRGLVGVLPLWGGGGSSSCDGDDKAGWVTEAAEVREKFHGGWRWINWHTFGWCRGNRSTSDIGIIRNWGN